MQIKLGKFLFNENNSLILVFLETKKEATSFEVMEALKNNSSKPHVYLLLKSLEEFGLVNFVYIRNTSRGPPFKKYSISKKGKKILQLYKQMDNIICDAQVTPDN